MKIETHSNKNTYIINRQNKPTSSYGYEDPFNLYLHIEL